MDVSEPFLENKLEDLYKEKNRLYDIWMTTGDTGLHIVTGQLLTQGATQPKLPIKTMLLSMYGLTSSQILSDSANLKRKGVIPKIIITPPDNEIKETEETASPCWHVKEARKKKGILRRVMGYLTGCFRPKTK